MGAVSSEMPDDGADCMVRSHVLPELLLLSLSVSWLVASASLANAFHSTKEMHFAHA